VTIQAAVRRTVRLSIVVATVGLVLVALPAQAAPVGWSDPAPVSWQEVVLVFVVGPLVLGGATVLLASLPSLIRGAQDAPAVTELEPVESNLDAILGGHEEPAALESGD